MRLIFLPFTAAQAETFRAVIERASVTSQDLEFRMITYVGSERGGEAGQLCREWQFPVVLCGENLEEEVLTSNTYRSMVAARQMVIREFSEATESFGPDVVIVPHDTDGVAPILIQQAALRGIPSLLIQDSLHGLEASLRSREEPTFREWPRYYPKGSSQYGHGGATMIAVSGERLKQALVESGVNPERLVLTGQPRWDAVINELQADSNEGQFASAAPRVLYISSPQRLPEPSDVDIARFVLDETLARFPASTVTVKLHPVESLQEYAAIIDAYRSDNRLKVVKDAKTSRWILNSDVVVMVRSTVGIEAMAAKKPLIVLSCFQSSAGLDFLVDVKGYLDVVSAEDYGEALARVVGDPQTRAILQAEQDVEVHRHLYKADGRAAERVTTLLGQMATEPAFREAAANSEARALDLYQEAMVAYYELDSDKGRSLLRETLRFDPVLASEPSWFLRTLRDQCYLWSLEPHAYSTYHERVRQLHHNLPKIDGLEEQRIERNLAEVLLLQARLAFADGRPDGFGYLMAAVKAAPAICVTRLFVSALAAGSLRQMCNLTIKRNNLQSGRS